MSIFYQNIIEKKSVYTTIFHYLTKNYVIFRRYNYVIIVMQKLWSDEYIQYYCLTKILNTSVKKCSKSVSIFVCMSMVKKKSL